MKTTLVCGLSGSGKTTFIKSFVRGVREKAVVLVNNFGAAGIDGEIFSAGGIESVELTSGCVCCTLKFDLITAIRRIVRELSPEHLLIELSGVARAKALARTDRGPARCGLSFGKIDIAPFGGEIADSRLVIIGEKLEERGIRQALNN